METDRADSNRESESLLRRVVRVGLQGQARSFSAVSKYLFGLVVSVLAITSPSRADVAYTAPNIIVIMADDLGYGDLSVYGQMEFSTPNLDLLAREGALFTQFYCGTSVCSPSRSSYMQGVDTGHSRIRGNANYFDRRTALRDSDITMAEVLRDAGYATATIGKWHLGISGSSGRPLTQGFDFWFGGVDQERGYSGPPGFMLNNEEFLLKDGTWDHDAYTSFAKTYLREHADSNRPFFLNLAYRTPHASAMRLVGPPGNRGFIDIHEDFADLDWSEADKRVASMIRYLDDDVGELLKLLDELGIAERTVVFFTSDNGPHAEGGSDPETFDRNGALRGIKRDMYEGGLRVPLIVRWTGTVGPETKVDLPFAFLDLMPTFADLAGAPYPESSDGLSFLPVLLGKPQPTHPHLYWELSHQHTLFRQAIRAGDWKALRVGHTMPLELYYLPDDPAEQNDLATAYPSAIAWFESLIENARVDNPEYYPGLPPDRTLGDKH